MSYRQVFEDTNEYGQPQTFEIDCSCEKRAICKDCQTPYVNLGQGLVCSDCLHSSEEDDSTELFESTNEHGFPQTYEMIDGKLYPVCPCCRASVMPNRGQGTACGTCQHEDLMECMHDWSE